MLYLYSTNGTCSNRLLTRQNEATKHMTTQSQTLAPILRGLRPLFPDELLGDLGWEHLLQLAADLPAAAAQHFGFEFRLNDSVPAADFCIEVRPGEAVAQHFICRGNAAAPGSAAAALGRLVAQIGDPHAALSQWAHTILLEYDLAEDLHAAPPEQRPEPGVFLSLHRQADPALVRQELADTLVKAAGWPAQPQEQRAIQRVFAVLPAKADLINAGVLPGRTTRAVRLVVSIRSADIADFLERLQWPGSIAAVNALVADLRDACSGFALSFDVSSEGLAPRLGLEVFIAGDWYKTKRSQWLPLIARLRERGWCSATKAEGLRAWPRKQLIYFNGRLFTTFQGINHIKITIQGDAIQAKAYTGVTYFPHLADAE